MREEQDQVEGAEEGLVDPSSPWAMLFGKPASPTRAKAPRTNLPRATENITRETPQVELTCHDFGSSVKLPGVVAELIDVAGVKAALAIVKVRGGTTLYVPAKAHAEHWLAELIGLSAMEALVKRFRDDELEIPRCAEAVRNAQAMQIAAEYEDGASNAELALRYGFTERGIRKVRQRAARLRHRWCDEGS